MLYRGHIRVIFLLTSSKKKLPPPKKTSEEESPEQEWVLCDRVEALAVPWQQQLVLRGYSICVGGFFRMYVHIYIYIYTFIFMFMCVYTGHVFFSKVWLRLGLAHPLGWSSGPVVPWSSGLMAGPGPLVLWSPGPLVLWFLVLVLVPWSSGPLVLWSLDPLVFGCGFWKDRKTANYSLWSF